MNIKIQKIAVFILTLCLSFSALAISYGSLDRKARNLPIRQATTKQQLVEQLTKGLKTDEEKARVIAAWIAYQVQRNGFEYQKLIRASNDNKLADPPLENDIFKTRIGTPEEFAHLFEELGSMAGLEVKTIYGYAGWRVPAYRYERPKMQAIEPLIDKVRGGEYKLQRYRSAWNAVKIDGEWKLLDTYWMIDGETRTGQEKSERAMRTFLEKRMKKTPSLSSVTNGKRLNDMFFFPRPQRMIKTHYPDDDEWQLLPSPKSWSTFTK